MDSPNYGSWVVYCQVSSDIGRTYFTGTADSIFELDLGSDAAKRS